MRLARDQAPWLADLYSSTGNDSETFYGQVRIVSHILGLNRVPLNGSWLVQVARDLTLLPIEDLAIDSRKTWLVHDFHE